MPDAPFRLDDPTDAKLETVTPRSEFHGEEIVPALSFALTIEGPNVLLDLLSPSLRAALYTTADGATVALPGMEAPTPKLRTKLLGALPLLVPAIEGGTLYVEWGIGGDLAIPAVRLDHWRATCKDGGTVALTFRAGSNKVGERDAGHLFGKIGQTITIRFAPPELAAPTEPTDRGAPLLDGAIADNARAATDAVIADAKRKRGRPPKNAQH